jgi:hypothetical protein
VREVDRAALDMTQAAGNPSGRLDRDAFVFEVYRE